MKTKKCSKCGKVKPISEFHKKKSSKDGHRSSCKTCDYEYQKKYKQLHKNISYQEKLKQEKLKTIHKIFENEKEYSFIKFEDNYIEYSHTCGNITKTEYYHFINRNQRCNNPKCISKKREETCMNKYGVKNPFQNKNIIEDIKIKNKLHLKKLRDKAVKDGYKLKIDRCKKDGFIPLFNENDYDGGNKKYKWKCDKCGYITKRFLRNSDHLSCRKCGDKISNPELEIRKFIDILNIEYNPNYRDYYDGKKFYEIDIFIPEKNIGIEFNGLYYHSQITGTKDKNYHINKTNYFKNKNIQILHIFEDEWKYKKSIVKSMIKSKLGLIQNKIYARKCIIKNVSSKESKQFLNDNHIQGAVSASIKLGLYYNHHLVSLMTLGKSRHNKNYEYELLRFASLKNISIVGGFSKLLKYFINNYNPISIITYADLRYSTGNVYKQNGFQYLHTSKPNYYYMNRNYNYRDSRLKYQKHKLKNKLDLFNPDLTEWENMVKNGYDRIWDCGNLVYFLS